MKILLVEDNPPDARLFTIMIREQGVHHDITIAQTIKESIAALEEDDFDAAFVDLNLPDSSGLETLNKVLECKPDLPVIVLTGMDNDALGDETILNGAQDYLPKDESSPTLLNRCLRHAVERKKLVNKLHQETQKSENMAKAQQDLRDMLHSATDSADQRSIPDAIEPRELVPEYRQVLERSVAEQIHKTGDMHTTKLLQEVVEKLGKLRALPKHLIEIHLQAIDEIMQNASDIPEGVYVEEGRILLLQTMGELASFYRRQSA